MGGVFWILDSRRRPKIFAGQRSSRAENFRGAKIFAHTSEWAGHSADSGRDHDAGAKAVAKKRNLACWPVVLLLISLLDGAGLIASQPQFAEPSLHPLSPVLYHPPGLGARLISAAVVTAAKLPARPGGCLAVSPSGRTLTDPQLPPLLSLRDAEMVSQSDGSAPSRAKPQRVGRKPRSQVKWEVSGLHWWVALSDHRLAPSV